LGAFLRVRDNFWTSSLYWFFIWPSRLVSLQVHRYRDLTKDRASPFAPPPVSSVFALASLPFFSHSALVVKVSLTGWCACFPLRLRTRFPSPCAVPAPQKRASTSTLFLPLRFSIVRIISQFPRFFSIPIEARCCQLSTRPVTQLQHVLPFCRLRDVLTPALPGTSEFTTGNLAPFPLAFAPSSSYSSTLRLP